MVHRLTCWKSHDGLITQDEMVDPIHGPVGFGFRREAAGSGNLIFGKTRDPGKFSLLMFSLLDARYPEHGSEIQPMIGPEKRFLKIGIDNLGKEGAIK